MATEQKIKDIEDEVRLLALGQHSSGGIPPFHSAIKNLKLERAANS